MSKRTFALIGLFVALTTGAALAQEEPTYEGRGYGRPARCRTKLPARRTVGPADLRCGPGTLVYHRALSRAAAHRPRSAQAQHRR